MTKDPLYTPPSFELAFNYMYLFLTLILGVSALFTDNDIPEKKDMHQEFTNEEELETLHEDVEEDKSLLKDDLLSNEMVELDDGDYKLHVDKDNAQIKSPEEKASFISRMFYMWMNPLLEVGHKRALQMSDLYPLSRQDESQGLGDTFEEMWAKEMKKEHPSVTKTIIRIHGLRFALSGIFKLAQDLLLFVGPFILRKLIQFIENKDQSFWVGLGYASVMGISAIIQSVILHIYFYNVYRVAMNFRSSMTSSIYRKSFRLSHKAKSEYTVGEIVNLQSVDSSRVESSIPYLHMLWSAPLQIIISMVMLWNVLGVSVLAGIFILVLMIPLNLKLSSYISNLQEVLMEKKDTRNKYINEILQGIRVIKYFAWENSFEAKVSGLRSDEVSVLKKNQYVKCVTRLLWQASPLLVSIATFALYTILGNKLTAEKAFTALSLFTILRFPIIVLPNVITDLIDARVSLKRFSKFMKADELEVPAMLNSSPEVVELQDSEEDNETEYAVVVKNATFEWNTDSPVLHNLDFKIKKGSLTAVVGSISQGKSSLLMALLGEMPRVSGEVTLSGSIAYCPQQAWIQNTILRNNITFGKPFDHNLYKNTVKVCELKSDLEILPDGDQTEIGEKGINLSGGQKQRVSLARATYQQSDVYLLDDPFSAVDAHVGKKIFENCVRKELKGKTRILVTHQLQYLPQVDQIIVIKNGKIKEMGTYSDLMKNGKEFSALIENHLSQKEQVAEDKPEIDTLRVSQSNIESSTVEKEVEKKSQSKLISEEQRDTGGVKISVYQMYAAAIGGFFAVLGILLLFLFDSAFKIGGDYFLSYWSSNNDKHSSAFYLVIYTLLGFINTLFIFGRNFYSVVASLKASISIHKEMFRCVMRSPVSFFDTTPVGRILNRFSKDQYSIDESLPATLLSAISTLFACLNIVFVIGSVTPWFLVYFLPLSFLYKSYQQYYLHSSRELQRLNNISRSPIYALFGETLNGLSTIRAYKKVQPFSKLNDQCIDQNIKAYFLSTTANRWLGLRLEFVGACVVGGASLFAVFGRDTLAAGLAGLSITYSLQLTSQLNWLVRMSTSVENELVAVERCEQYTKLEPEAEEVIQDSRPPLVWPTLGEIEFVNMSLRYREGLPLVLKNLSFNVKSKEKIGVVGRTGAGKSSLMNALFRITEPSSGHIIVDGVNIHKIGLRDLRSCLAIIPQDPTLFEGTIRSNLDPFDDVSDDEIWNALEMCSIKCQIEIMTDGLYSKVQEFGENLSVGTRQLLCLARAIIRKPKILILDEATASVDYETDALIQKTIREQFIDSTVLTIAHRINTVLHCDRIMVMDKGEIAEYDSPQNLLNNKNSIFSSLYKQSGM